MIRGAKGEKMYNYTNHEYFQIEEEPEVNLLKRIVKALFGNSFLCITSNPLTYSCMKRSSRNVSPTSCLYTMTTVDGKYFW